MTPAYRALIARKVKPSNRSHQHRPSNLNPFVCERCLDEAEDEVTRETIDHFEDLKARFQNQAEDLLPTLDPDYLAGRISRDLADA